MSEGSFWTNNSCCPTWSSTLDSWWGNKPPRLAEPGRFQILIRNLPGVEIREAKVDDSKAITEFWHRYFSTSSRCKTYVPPEHIQSCVKERVWQIIVAIDIRSGSLVGTGVRRYIQNLHIGEAVWKKAAMIDYFCVHPAWRKKGVGRTILGVLQNTGSVPLPPHLILWEGIKPSITPLTVGCYWVKEKVGKTSKVLEKLPVPHVWPPPGAYVWSDWTSRNSKEVECWKTTSGFVIVWDIFHRRVPDGAKIGVIVYSSTDTSLEEFVEEGSYGVLLSPTKPTTSGWSLDSPWQLVAYNCIAAPGMTYPYLGF